MGKLTKRPGRMLATGVLALAGTGILMLAGAGILVLAGTAQAQPASTSVCKNLTAAFASINAYVKAHPGITPTAEANLVASQLTPAASTGSPAVKAAVRAYINDVKADAAANNVDLAKLNADAGVVATTACTPSGAPATGGGSAAGLQDPAWFGLGGAVVLAGLVVLALALRSRPRAGLGPVGPVGPVGHG